MKRGVGNCCSAVVSSETVRRNEEVLPTSLSVVSFHPFPRGETRNDTGRTQGQGTHSPFGKGTGHRRNPRRAPETGRPFVRRPSGLGRSARGGGPSFRLSSPDPRSTEAADWDRVPSSRGVATFFSDHMVSASIAAANPALVNFQRSPSFLTSRFASKS